ncbi:MAG: MFS transporter, partial [Candidatus Bathyarchaeota archaeon]|nr:MFS transporter [Candidatus Bathyarchaeota archaeon]
LLIGIKSIGLLSFILDPIERAEKESKSWRVVLGYRDFNFYLLAYVLFNIAAGLVSLIWDAVPSTEAYEAASESGQVLRLLGLCFSAIAAGLVADRIGRKKPIIFGTIMLGAAYAIVGLLTTPDTYFANLLLSGIAWGILMALYLAVPGDLAIPSSTERFYTVGWVFPLILYIDVQGSERLIGVPPRIDIFSTILSVILFVSIIPLLYAVEPL